MTAIIAGCSSPCSEAPLEEVDFILPGDTLVLRPGLVPMTDATGMPSP